MSRLVYGRDVTGYFMFDSVGSCVLFQFTGHMYASTKSGQNSAI